MTAGLPRMGAQRPAQKGRTKPALACPERTGRTGPDDGPDGPDVYINRTGPACPDWAPRGLPRKGAQRPAQNGRTEACSE